MKTIFRHSWTSKHAKAQPSDQSNKCKAPTKEHRQNDYRAQDITMDVVAEVIEVRRFRVEA